MSDSSSSLDLEIRKARLDPSALAQLLEQYRPFLRLVAEQALDGAIKARCDASDVVQQTMVETIPDAQREAVALRHLEGLSLEEIAVRLDRSVLATAGLIKRGLQALRQKMSQESWR